MDTEEITSPDADEFIDLMKNLALEPYMIKRANTVPFDRGRYENDAEHSFSLGIAAACLAPLLDEKLDVSKVCAYALIHDLEEIYTGDTPVYSAPEALAAKEERAKSARAQLGRQFGDRYPWLIRCIEDYAAMADDESKFVYALDKILPHSMVIIGRYHPARPTWTAYKATEQVAREKIAATYPRLTRLFDELCQRLAQIPGFFSPEKGADGDNLVPGRAITIAAQAMRRAPATAAPTRSESGDP